METEELKKKALGHVKGMSFSCFLSAYGGGACGDGWDGDGELDLSRENLLYLIVGGGKDENLFKKKELKKVDIEKTLSELARQMAWPDGITARVNSIIPEELKDLAERIDDYVEFDSYDDDDKSDFDDSKNLREEIMELEGGEYTFSFNISASVEYEFDDDYPGKVSLTARQAVAILRAGTINDSLFKGICKMKLDWDSAAKLINDKAEKMRLAEERDHFSYSAECESLDGYIDAWISVLMNIDDGIITEENLGRWLEYFDDADNFYSDIEEWMNERDD